VSEASNLRSLPPPPSAAPVPDVVAALERWLIRAKAGEVRGFIIVAVQDDSVSTGIEKGDGSRHELLSGLELAKARYIDWLLETSTDIEDPEPKP
jgi:hypothetical protein